jgi:sugar O-acyltransferase (sialic acid O-acetyltransferase NeuD family)
VSEIRKKLVIVGDSAFAEVAFEYFSHDSTYSVVAFAVEREFLKKDNLLGLPIVELEEIAQKFPPKSHDVFVAVVYTQLNRLRTRLAHLVKSMDYKLASYVSSNANVWPNATLGEHCFIFEDNTIQPFVRIGNNVILWSGNHIGHHSTIKDNVFISSQVVISGFCEIGENCFLGVNSTFSNNIVVAKDCWIGPGALLTKNTDKNMVYRINASEPAKISALRFLKVPN